MSNCSSVSVGAAGLIKVKLLWLWNRRKTCCQYSVVLFFLLFFSFLQQMSVVGWDVQKDVTHSDCDTGTCRGLFDILDKLFSFVLKITFKGKLTLFLFYQRAICYRALLDSVHLKCFPVLNSGSLCVSAQCRSGRRFLGKLLHMHNCNLCFSSTLFLQVFIFLPTFFFFSTRAVKKTKGFRVIPGQRLVHLQESGLLRQCSQSAPKN